MGPYAQERVLGCERRQPPGALSQGILEGGETLKTLSGKLSSVAPWPKDAQDESFEVSHTPGIDFSTQLGPA